MFLNRILLFSQQIFSRIYEKSLVLKKIDWLILLNIILVYVFSAFAESDFIGYFAIFGVILTVVKLLTKKGEKFKFSYADLFLLLYFLIVIISVSGSTLFYFSLKGFCKTLTYLAFYVTLVHYLQNNRKSIKYILLLLAMICFGESLVAIHQNFLSVSEISGWQDISHLNPEEVMTRVYGSLKPYNPNLFGGYMLSVLPTMLALIVLPLKNKHYKTAVFGFFASIVSALAIFLTGCRGAYVGLFFEILILLLFTYKFLRPLYRKMFCFISTIIACIFTIAIISISSIRSRVFSIFAMREDSSNSFRFNVYNSCIDMFKDNWLLGIGVGNQNFREIYGLYMQTGFDALSAYNIYLETAVESGIFALISFLGFLLLNIYSALRYIFRKKNINVLYLIIALISLSGLLIHGFVDTVFFRPQLQFVFWTMIAIIRVITTGKGVNYVRR